MEKKRKLREKKRFAHSSEGVAKSEGEKEGKPSEQSAPLNRNYGKC